MRDYLLVIVSMVFVQNYVLARFLGLCPFINVSRKTDAAIGESPVAGDGATRVRTEDVASDAVRPWTWDDAVWHYDDGTEVIYPAYDKIDWSKE